MNTNYLVMGVVLFVVSISVIELMRYAYRHVDVVRRTRVRKRIRKYTFTESDGETLDIVKQRVYSEVPLFNRLLRRVGFVQSLDALITQANSRMPIGFFMLLSVLLMGVGYWSVSLYMKQHAFMPIMVALIGGMLPFVYLARLKSQRIAKFRQQLPEGLDLIARSLRAGHAFSSGLKLAADEFPDPLGSEFEETLEEINYGVSTAQALKNMVARIDCPEARYFVVAVILQRETGGNLAEILESLAQLMRDKVKFEGKVRSLSAEGKITALILVLTPFLMAAYLEFVTPGYLSIFITHPMGRMMLYTCMLLMIAGIIVLRRMVDIKV
jgi:tight adherence protein B